MRSALAFAAATALVAAPLAAGHAPVQVGGYVSTVSEVKPNVLGLQVAILGGADRIRLANLSGKTIVVLDASGRPLLRFEATAVFRNRPGGAAALAQGGLRKQLCLARPAGSLGEGFGPARRRHRS